jgi:hypothetical protein
MINNTSSLRSRGIRRRLLATALATFATAAVVPAAADAADTVPPTITAGASMSTSVASTATLTAVALDNVGVASVKWYLDGNEVAWDGSAPYTVNLNTSIYTGGAHRVYAKARDAAGNWATSKDVTLTIPAPAPAWQLVQQDDFNGTAVDSTKWSVYGPSIPGNAGFGLRDYRATTVGNGLLTITAQMIDGKLVSGGLRNKLDQKYGKFEFRVRTDADPSLATSGVVLTWPQNNNWPADGENNIYETTLDADRIPVKSYVHYGADNRQYWFHHLGVDGKQFHTYAMEWTADYIKMYRDGLLVWTITDKVAIPDVAHHLSAQLDAFKNTMTGTVRMQMDWVKIYKKA